MFMKQNPTGTKKRSSRATIPSCRQREKNMACEDGMGTRVNGCRRSAHKILSGRSVLSYGKMAG